MAFVVRLGCYQVGQSEQVLRAGAKSLFAGDNLFRLRWAIVRDGADCCHPALDDFQSPTPDDEFTISFTPPRIGPYVVGPKNKTYLDTSEKIPRVKLNFAAGAQYGLTISAPPSGVCPQYWPSAAVTISVAALADLETTRQSLISALNAWPPAVGEKKYWKAVQQGASGIEFRLADAIPVGSVAISDALEEMPIANASNPASVIEIFVTDPEHPERRIATQKGSVEAFLKGCGQVEQSAVVSRAVEALSRVLRAGLTRTRTEHPLLNDLERFSGELAAALYERFMRETSLDDLLRDSRKQKAGEFSTWFDETTARYLNRSAWTPEDQGVFLRALVEAVREAIRLIDEAKQGKSVVALSLAMGTSVANYRAIDAPADYTSLAELCGLELEVDASPFAQAPLPGKRYERVTAQIEWKRGGVDQGTWGMYPQSDRDCFNDASGPLTALPTVKFVEDGLFVLQPDDTEPVFKASVGDGLLSISIDNASPQSFWTAFFISLTDTSTPPDVGSIISSNTPVLSTFDPTQQVVASPMPVGTRTFGPIHWQQFVPEFDPLRPGKKRTKFIWFCARSAAGGWLPPIPVLRDASSPFGLKLPPSLSLGPNEVAALSAGTPAPPSFGANRDFFWEQEATEIYTLSVIVDFSGSKEVPNYYDLYGINEFQMLVFRRPGDLPKDLDQNLTFVRGSSRIDTDFAYYQATGWFNTLLDGGWYPLPDVSSYLDPTGDLVTLKYQTTGGAPIPVAPGWKYIVVVVAKRPQGLCYQVPRSAAETGLTDPNTPDPSYFAAQKYEPDGILLARKALPAWRYLAANPASYGAGSIPRFNKAIRFEYSAPAITNEGYIPSEPFGEDELVPINSQSSIIP
jgi:hypothetical protein